MNDRITILTATELEQQPMRDRFGECALGYDLRWVVGGMGAAATAIATHKIIQNSQPDLIIQAGIAGVLSCRGVAVGDVMLVGSDYQADIGAWRNDEERYFKSFDTLSETAIVTSDCAESLSDHFRVVAARSTNSACSRIPTRTDEVLESMEGAAFFGVCHSEKVRFLQLRAISNHVDDNRNEWQIPIALESLTQGLGQLLSLLKL